MMDLLKLNNILPSKKIRPIYLRMSCIFFFFFYNKIITLLNQFCCGCETILYSWLVRVTISACNMMCDSVVFVIGQSGLHVLCSSATCVDYGS